MPLNTIKFAEKSMCVCVSVRERERERVRERERERERTTGLKSQPLAQSEGGGIMAGNRQRRKDMGIHCFKRSP